MFLLQRNVRLLLCLQLQFTDIIPHVQIQNLCIARLNLWFILLCKSGVIRCKNVLKVISFISWIHKLVIQAWISVSSASMEIPLFIIWFPSFVTTSALKSLLLAMAKNTIFLLSLEFCEVLGSNSGWVSLKLKQDMMLLWWGCSQHLPRGRANQARREWKCWLLLESPNDATLRLNNP